MPPPKLHLNEHLSWHLADQLRRYGFDVTSTVEQGMIEEDDEAQFAFAVSQQRAIVTINHKDFVPLHERYVSKGVDHWGIILSTEESVQVYRRRLLRLLNAMSAEDLKNQIKWLNEFK